MGSKRLSLKVVLALSLIVSACGQADERSPAGGEAPQRAFPKRQAEFLSASEVFGPLKVKTGDFQAESRIKPWSSWWLPTRETYLFREQNGQLSPLQKYDRFAQRVTGRPSAAASYEEKFLYDPSASTWEGRCDAWAVASLMEREPVLPVTREGVTFGVGDQKALLIKKYELFQGHRVFGQRYNGDRLSVFDDIYPDQFHLLLQHQLFDRGRPFIMDKDPGVAVWNTPVWKAQTRIVQDDQDRNALHVTTWVFGASPFVTSYDYVGTLSVVFEYTYDLYGSWQADGYFLVESGEWTGQSLDYHPDFVTVLPELAVTDSLNKELDPALIDQIVADRGRSLNGK